MSRSGARRRAATCCGLALVLGCSAAEPLRPMAPEAIDPSAALAARGAADPPRPDVQCRYGEVADPLAVDVLDGPGGYAVATLDADLERDGRELDSRFWYPIATDAGWNPFSADPVAAGAHPLIVYSHGFYSSKDEATAFGEHMASRGYIVAAPTFPLSNMLADAPTLGDLHNQARDVSFLIDTLLARAATEGDLFEGRVDPGRIGAAGMSMGGMTTSIVTYHRELNDERIRAAATLAGPGSTFGPSFYDHRAVPLLAIHGDIDALVEYEAHAVETYVRAAPYARLLTIEGASHTGFAHIPFEGMVLTVGAWMAPDGAHADNPDGMSCALLDDLLPDDPTFLEPLGGEANGIVADEDDPRPCGMQWLALPAIAPETQRALARPVLASFFDAYLAEDEVTRERNCHFLNEVVPTLPGVALH